MRYTTFRVSNVQILRPKMPMTLICHLIVEFNGDFKHEHPAIIQQNLPEIEEFARVSLVL